jgi:hypothetical protein
MGASVEAAGIEAAQDPIPRLTAPRLPPQPSLALACSLDSAGQRSGGQALVQLTRGGLRFGAHKADTESHAPAA